MQSVKKFYGGGFVDKITITEHPSIKAIVAEQKRIFKLIDDTFDEYIRKGFRPPFKFVVPPYYTEEFKQTINEYIDNKNKEYGT